MDNSRNDIKTAMGMIHLVKQCFSEIYNTYGSDEKIEDSVNRGMLMLEDLDELLMQGTVTHGEVVTELAAGEYEWHPLKKDDMPPENTDILFSTKSGQVFEGFVAYHTINTDKTKAGNQRLNKEGERWFRYHFRDFLPTSMISAWSYKPGAYNK